MPKSRTGKKRSDKPSLLNEVDTLFRQTVDALKTASQSEELKNIEEEVRQGLHGVGSRVVDAIRRTGESPVTQELKTQAERVLKLGKSKAKKAKIVRCLKIIGEEFQTMAENLQKGHSRKSQTSSKNSAGAKSGAG